ncbi:hypothetical protein EKD04_017575 [Chloroflexales bacterium ZM16-3]|nr:hypothetical protein [Chloroflexales bacterium ZM16-3]
MQRTVWFDTFELDAGEIAEYVSTETIVRAEARYSARNAMNRDSLEVRADLIGPPWMWSIAEMPMDDDSLNCLVLVLDLDEAGEQALRAAIAPLVETDYAGFWLEP